MHRFGGVQRGTGSRCPGVPQPHQERIARNDETGRRRCILALSPSMRWPPGALYLRRYGPSARIDTADAGREGNWAAARNHCRDRLLLDEAIARLQRTLHVEATPGKPDGDRIGRWMGKTIEP